MRRTTSFSIVLLGCFRFHHLLLSRQEVNSAVAWVLLLVDPLIFAARGPDGANPVDCLDNSRSPFIVHYSLHGVGLLQFGRSASAT